MQYDVVSFDEYQDAIRHIRHTVFTLEQGVDADLDFDGLDAKALQVLCTDAGKPVGTGRMLNDGHVGRIAVLQDYRGKGIGTGIITTLIDAARSRRFREIHLHAQVNAVPFYEKLGFEATGPDFMEAGILHTPMSRGLGTRAMPPATDTTDIRLVTGTEALTGIAPVLLQLRPQYSTPDLVARIQAQQASEGYQVACLYLNGAPACVAGFVINEKLAWGRCLYVDDLVTAEQVRSRGAGQAMIAWLRAYAREAGCDQLHLDSGMHRKDAHRFYDREGFDRSSLHFQISEL